MTAAAMNSSWPRRSFSRMSATRAAESTAANVQACTISGCKETAGRFSESKGRTGSIQLAVFERPADSSWTLRKFAHETLPNSSNGKGSYFDKHELHNRRTGEAIGFPGWEWAEVDGKRLVWAERGKLFAARLSKSGLGKPTELQDFNAMKFERIEAPY